MQPSASERKLTGRTVLLSILAFFAVIIGVNVTMMILAIKTLPGTEVDNAYGAGLAYNREISAAQAQDARGWRVAGQVERKPDGHGNVGIEARDATGAPLTGLAFSARLSRPTDQRADHRIALTERERGVYRGTADNVAAGQWDLVIEADRGSERVFLSRSRLMLR
jgi:nitrogen fixation protein FixH